MKLRRNLTVNIGVRYEMITGPTEVNGKIANMLNVTDVQPTVGQIFTKNPTTKNFAPRVGFAWDPFGDGKTSIRSAFGMFDVLPLPYLLVNEIPRTVPFYKSGTVTTLPIGSFPTGMYNLIGPATYRTIYIEPQPHRAYKMQWNLNIQRELGKDFTLNVGYVGSRGVHLPWRDQNLNTVYPTLTSAGFVLPPSTVPVLNPGFGQIRAILFNDDAYYQGLQTSLVKKLSHGLQLQLAYTWSKSLDDSSTGFSAFDNLNGVNDPLSYNTAYNRGPSDFNIAQVFVGSWMWNLPSGHSWNSPTRALLGDWQFGGIITAQTGSVFTPLVSGDIAGTRLGSTDSNQRPNVVNSPACANPVNPGKLLYINTSCFTFPAKGVIYNSLSRNRLTGPGLANVDFSLFKTIPVPKISESFKVQFRMEFFNALNRTNLASPTEANNFIFNSNGSVNPTGGLIVSTVTPSRELQFGLKLIF